MKKLILVISFIFIYLNSYAQISVPSGTSDLSLLAEYLEGNFSTEEQSKQDTNYFHIVLHIKPIWIERSDGIWFYVEQAAAWKQEKPYRQRVYKLSQLEDNLFVSEVYTFENPLNYAGDWKKDNPLSDLSPEKLNKREGCTVYLSKVGDANFIGNTKGKGCEGDSRAAKYVTSEVTITPDSFISWDRGFDEKDIQVWGAVNGPYIFKKIK